MYHILTVLFILFLNQVFANEFIEVSSTKSTTNTKQNPQRNHELELLLFRAADYLSNGQIELARKDLETLLQKNPTNIDGNQLYGTLLLKTNENPQKAIFHLEKAISQPGEKIPSIYANYLEALRSIGQTEEARKKGYAFLEQQLIPLTKESGSFYLNLGVIERTLKNYQEAYEFFHTAIQCNPELISGWIYLGELLTNAGLYADTERFLLQAVTQYHPNSYYLYYMLGTAYHYQKKLTDALQCYLTAESLNDEHLLTKGNIAAAYQGLGRAAEALSYYEKIIPLMPDDGGIRNNYGALLGTMNRKEEEIYWLKEALKLDPTMEHAMVNLAGHYQDEGLLALARTYVLQAANGSTKSRSLLQLRHALMLSPTPFSYRQMIQERHAIIDNLKKIILSPPVNKSELDTTLDRIHFYLSYHGFNDRKFQETVGEIYHFYIADINHTKPKIESSFIQQYLTTHAFPLTTATTTTTSKQLQQKEDPSNRPKTRIGFISKFFGIFEPHGMLLDGVMKYLPRQQFEVICLLIARTDMKPPSSVILESCNEIYEISLVYQHAITIIQKIPLDALIFADVVSEPINHFLIFNRIAPIQLAFWGNPITSGSNKIDYYISADIMEHPYRTRMQGKDDPYSEQVILLEGQGIWYFQPTDPATELEKVNISHLVGPVQDFTREDFQIPEEAFVFLLPQSVFKIHPLYDLVLSEILHRSPSYVHLVVTGGRQVRWTTIYLLRLVKAVGVENIHRLHIIERVSSESFYNLLKISNVILHPFPFDGSRTSADSLIVNIPYVTLPTEYLKGRMGFTYLRTMNIPELVAGDIEEYISISLQLVKDPIFYHKIQQKIHQSMHLIWEDMYYPYQWTIFFQRLFGYSSGMSYYSFLQQTAQTRTSITSDIAKSKQREMNGILFDETMQRTGKYDRMKAWQLNPQGMVISETILPKDGSKWPNLFQYWVEKRNNNSQDVRIGILSEEIEKKYMNEEVLDLPTDYLFRIKKPPSKYLSNGNQSSNNIVSRRNPDDKDDHIINFVVPPAGAPKKTTINENILNSASTTAKMDSSAKITSSSSSSSSVGGKKRVSKVATTPIKPGDVRITSTPDFASPGSIHTSSTTSSLSSGTASVTSAFASTSATVSSPPLVSGISTFENLPKFKKLAFDLFSAANRQNNGGDPNVIQIAYTTTTPERKDPTPLTKHKIDAITPANSQKYTINQEKDGIPIHMEDFYGYFKKGQYAEAIAIGKQLLSTHYAEGTKKDSSYPLLLLELGLIHYLAGEYQVAFNYCQQTQKYITERATTGAAAEDVYLESSILYACLGMTSLYRPVDLSNLKDTQQRIQYLQTSYELHAMELVEISHPATSTTSSDSTTPPLSRPKRLHSKVFNLNQASIENSLIQSYHSFFQYDYCIPFLQQYYDFPPFEAEGGYVLVFSTVQWTSNHSLIYLQQLEDMLIENQLYYYHPKSVLPSIASDNAQQGGGGRTARSGEGNIGKREYRSLLQQIQYLQMKGEHLLNSMIKCIQNHPSYQSLLQRIQTNLLAIITQISLHHPNTKTTPTDRPIKTIPFTKPRPGIALITQYYLHPDSHSSIQKDMDTALMKNLQNPFIEEIYLLTEENVVLTNLPNYQKVKQHIVGKRLSFRDAFLFANHYLLNRTVILANADVYFDHTLQIFYEKVFRSLPTAAVPTPTTTAKQPAEEEELHYQLKPFPNNTFIALLKWMDRADSISLSLRTDSQDAWIFQPPLPASMISMTDFHLGLPRCDNRLIDILYQYQYQIVNPVFHIHAIEIQEVSHGSNINSNSSSNSDRDGVAEGGRGGEGAMKDGKYVNTLYGMKNAVLGNGRNAFITDFLEL